MKMSMEQHRAFGDLCKRFRVELLKPHIFCAEMKSSRFHRRVMATLKALDRMRSTGEDIMFRDYPQDANAKIYYGIPDESIHPD